MMWKLVAVLSLVSVASALQNGLARTPPMGWMSWQRFRCNIDCVNDPKNCISEKLFMDMADRMAADGYKDAGYQYVNIDDCWASKERDATTMKLIPDPVRFPSGMKALADYVHSKGLKLGTYGDMGTYTCGGYPGSKFTMEIDAQTFAEWGIDSFKMDGCYSTTDDFSAAYPLMEYYLNATGRPILFSCSWPAYEMDQKDPVPYDRIAQYCNIWRNCGDIQDSWQSVQGILNWYGNDKWNFTKVAGPGNFNDPDMIIVGNPGLSTSEAKAQMAMWAIMAAPLMLSADLRIITDEMRAIILHKGVLAINQDPLGIQGTRISTLKSASMWMRPLSNGCYAIAILNTDDGGSGTTFTTYLQTFNIKDDKKYTLTEVWEGTAMGTFGSADKMNIHVDVSSAFIGKLTPA